MKKIIEMIEDEIKEAFVKVGYKENYGGVTISNRPDLCQYQCNGALSAAKEYRKAPIQIAKEVVTLLEESNSFQSITAIAPGFINIIVSDRFLSDYVNQMKNEDHFGCEPIERAQTIVIDYGGANVAKPLHVGHLRTAIIGESIKRIARYLGHKVIGDVHLGDWGLPIGLIITELKKRQPDLIYFDDNYTGEYPSEPPFTMTELEEIYPYASGYSKDHLEYKEDAQTAIAELQNGRIGYKALWKHIMKVSVEDLKKNYANLNVDFDLWKGESDALPYIENMVKYMKEEGYAYISQGALVVDVVEDTDNKEVPPCMILKSNGATLYDTTDLATLVERQELYHPDKVIYVVDKRQGSYFERIFRCAKKTKIVDEKMELIFVGFGTMNGKDGKPFKTRDGGIMRLESLIHEIVEEVYSKVMSNRDLPESEVRVIANKVGLAAIKYGDLSNQASKDYVFDIERFTSFEGNTGPYILYTIVRIKSVLNKFVQLGGTMSEQTAINPPSSESETAVLLQLTRFSEMIQQAFDDNAPHKICQYCYELSDIFNKFYHENKIIVEEDQDKKNSWIQMIAFVEKVLTQCIELLGMEAPERM